MHTFGASDRGTFRNVNITQVLQAFSHMHDFMMSKMSVKQSVFQRFRDFKNDNKTQGFSIVLFTVSKMSIKPKEYHYFCNTRSIEFYEM